MNDQQTTGDSLTTHHVLVVDDDQDFADTLSRLLTLEGYEVAHAYSLAAARKALDSFPAEVALIDIRMGVQSGLKLVSEFHKRDPEVTCIMMTAFASAETAINALQEGAYDYLCKPFYKADLLATLERCFERAALTRGREQAEAALRRRNKELEELNARLQSAVSSMQALSTYVTLRDLCAAVLDEVVAETGGQCGVLALKEGGQLTVKHGTAPGFAPASPLPIEVETLFQDVLSARHPVVARLPHRASAAAPNSPPDTAEDSLLAFPLIGEGQEPVGVIGVQTGPDRPFTLQDREIGQILASFASEAIRLVRALEDLTSGEERLRKVIDNSPSLICLKDLEGRYVVVNKRFEEWHGYKQIDVVGQTSHDLFPEDIAVLYAAQDEQVLGSVGVVDQEIQMDFADGTSHSVKVTKFPVLDVGGRPMGVGAIGTDITDSKHAEEQLRQAQKMEALGQLTGGVAHDFNNLLAVISGNVDLMRDELAGQSNLEELAEDALSAAQSGAELTHRLLAFGRRQTLLPQATDAGQLVRGMSRILARTLGETIEIKRVLNDGLWPVEIDRNQLETSLLNLAINARDAMPEGGTLTIETANAALAPLYAGIRDAVIPGDYVMVSVADTGTGMSSEVVDGAIQPFFTTKDAGHGSGLGLSMVYGFVKQSGGHLEIASALGEGTTVKLYLPKARKRAHDAGTRRPDPLRNGETGERILVVEDHPDVRKLAKRILTRLGYEVLEAADAKSALGILHDGLKVDLLFTDIVLPGEMNGMELARAARARDPALKVLYTSGYAEKAVSRGEPTGDEIKLIKKPFVKEALARMVSHALASDAQS